MKVKSLMGALCAPILAVSLFTGQAAANTLDFGIIAPTTGGSLSYAGGATALVGAGIEVDNVVGLGTPLNAGITSLCDSCTLDFTSGVSTGGWVFGSGGTITITGGIDFPDATPDIATGTTLLTGTFDSAQIFDIGSGSFEFQILGASFSDTKDPDLLAFYGLPDIQFVGGLNLSFQTNAAMGDGFSTSDLLSGSLVNQVVPVPAAVWLFGSGLLGLAGLARRKR